MTHKKGFYLVPSSKMFFCLAFHPTLKKNAIFPNNKCLVPVKVKSSNLRLQHYGDVGQSVSLNPCLLCLVMLSLCRDLQAAISVRGQSRRKQTRWNLQHSFDSTLRDRFTLSMTESKSASVIFLEGAQIKLYVWSLVSRLNVPSENNRIVCYNGDLFVRDSLFQGFFRLNSLQIWQMPSPFFIRD